MKRTLAAFAVAICVATPTVTPSAAEGVPGLRGADHIGFTVPDLEQAVGFFRDVIGCRVFYPLGPFASPKNNWMKDSLNVHPRATIPKMRLVRCGSGANLEIFQYTAPDQRKTPPRNSDIGGHHIAFYTADMTAAVAYLKSKGVKVLGAPTKMTGGPSKGETWVYLMAPWGMQLELVSYPKGKAYETNYKGRLWDPRKPGM